MAGHEDNKWDFEAGLLGVRDQDLVFKELEDRFFAPDAALGQSYLWLVARMEFARVSGKLPAYPKNDLAKQKDWQEAQEKLFALLKARQDAVYERAADAVALKQGAAKASTVAAVLRSSPEQARKLPGEEIADMFPLLDRAQQELILGTLFDWVNVPAMAGPLAAILDQQDFPGGSLLRVYALEVLLQVNPQIGRERMLAEMRAPHADSLNNPGFMIRCLSRLPDAALPELNQLFLKRLEEADYPLLDLYAGLTGRYATDAVLPQVKKVYQDRVDSWDCAARDGLMRYFLRVDPDFGIGLLKGTGAFCADESLKELARLKRWAEVQPAIIQHLDDPDAWVARDAADLLGKWGDGAAKDAMLARLRAFHERWKPRANEFRNIMLAAREISAAQALQYGLVYSLTNSKNWKFSEAEKAEVESLEF